MRVNQEEGVPKSLQRAVILILMHSEAGTMGVVLNNLLGPPDTARVFPFADEIKAIADMSPETWLYDGGLAQVKSLTLLHQQKDASSARCSNVSTRLFDLFANICHVSQEVFEGQKQARTQCRSRPVSRGGRVGGSEAKKPNVLPKTKVLDSLLRLLLLFEGKSCTRPETVELH